MGARCIGMMVVLGLVLVSGPAEGQRLPTAELIWPPAPEQPRIRYLGSWNSTEDLGIKKSFLSRLGSSLTGSRGEMPLVIQRPFDVLATSDGRLYVTDALNPYIAVFDPTRKQATRLGVGLSNGLVRPAGMGGDSHGNLYVADPTRKTIFVFDAAGAVLRTIGGPHLFRNPQDVAVDDVADRVYVVDSHLHQVLVFNRVGVEVGRIGKNESDTLAVDSREAMVHEPSDDPAAGRHGGGAASPGRRDLVSNRGSGPGEFNFPFAVAVGPDGRVYVTDQMNFRVQVFDRSGEFLRAIGKAGTGPGNFSRPKGIAVSAANHIYVVDAAFNNIQMFDPDGQLLMFFGAMGPGEAQFWLPLGIDVSPTGAIYVADRYNHRVQMFQYLPESGQPPEQ